ncbi:MAG: hypothetical protein ACE5HB_09270, partial [Terriglobia bacterium]
EIPRPVYEENTVEFGVSLFQRLRAAALLIAGAHPKSNTDGSADVVLFNNRRSLFNLVNQVFLRETGDAPFVAIQVRALGYKRGTALPGVLPEGAVTLAESLLDAGYRTAGVVANPWLERTYGLGQGATMVAALWGVFVWREFKAAPAGTGKLIAFMFAGFLAGLTLIIVARIA